MSDKTDSLTLDQSYRMLKYFEDVQALVKGCVFHGESIQEVAKVFIHTEELKAAMVKTLKSHPDYESKKLDYPIKGE